MNYELPGLVLLPPGLLPPGASSLRFRLACCFLAVKVNKTMKMYIQSIIIINYCKKLTYFFHA